MKVCPLTKTDYCGLDFVVMRFRRHRLKPISPISTAGCLSVCLSLRLSVRDVEVSWSHTLEFFENYFTAS